MFRIGQNQCLTGLGIEDFTGQLQQLLGCNRGRACRGARGKTDRLAGIDVEHEKGLSSLGGSFSIVMAVEAHVSLGEASYAMWIDGQQPSLEMA